MPYESACEMMLTFTPERNNWDDFMTGLNPSERIARNCLGPALPTKALCVALPEMPGILLADTETVEQINGDDDRIVKITFRVPLAPAKTQHSRLLQSPDYPEKGNMTFM